MTRTLADVDGVRVTSVRCRAPADGGHPPAPPETGALRRVVLPVNGVFSCAGRGASYVLGPGSGLVLEADEPYRFGHPAAGGDECVVIALSADAWAEWAEWAENVPAGLRPYGRGERLRLDSRDLWRTVLFRAAAEGRRGEPHAVRELAVLHLAELGARGGGTVPASGPVPASRRRVADAAAAFLAAHYAEPIPRLLDAAAAAADCSPYHLARAFRAVHGMTLHAYRERLRTAAALRALADGADDLARLGTSLGYASHGHFTDRLRRAVASPPSRIRAVLRESYGRGAR